MKNAGSETNHKIISQKYGDDTAFTIEITDTTPSKFNADEQGDLWSPKSRGRRRAGVRYFLTLNCLDQARRE